MENKKNIEIGEGTLPVGHSLVLGNEDEERKGDKLKTFAIPRSNLFSSLSSFLPEFVSSCKDIEREVRETGTTRFAVEEFDSDSENSSDSSNSSYSSDSSADMSLEEEEKTVPVVEMRFAMAPIEAVEMINKAEDKLPDPTQQTAVGSLVSEM